MSRVTLVTRNTQGIKAKLKAHNRTQRDRIRTATFENGKDEQKLVAELAPKDTSWMADHTDLQFTRRNYNYVVGYFAKDFVGQLNDHFSPPFVITSFYPVYVVFGTSRMAGRNFLAAAHRLLRRRITQRYYRALNAPVAVR